MTDLKYCLDKYFPHNLLLNMYFPVVTLCAIHILLTVTHLKTVV